MFQALSHRDSSDLQKRDSLRHNAEQALYPFAFCKALFGEACYKSLC